MLDGWTDTPCSWRLVSWTTDGKARPSPSPVRLDRHAAAEVTEYKSPTALVWLLGRICCTGTRRTHDPVHALQEDQINAVPLSAYGKSYRRHPAW